MVKPFLIVVLLGVLLSAGCSERSDAPMDTANADSASPLETVVSETELPSYDCDSVESGSIEAMICNDSELAMLDRKLDQVYQTAVRSPKGKSDGLLKAGQIGWIKGRNECWKAEDKRACVLNNYQRRIAELEASYSLVPGKGPVRYRCSEGEVTATYFQTDPPTAVAEFNGQKSLMFQQPSGSGARYQGRNESLWEHQGEATVIWGHGAGEMRCKID